MAKGPRDYFSPHDHNLYCSVCGKKIKFSEAKKHWQGQWRCDLCWEPRHPQDFVRGVPEKEMAVEVVQKDSDTDIIAPAFPQSGAAVTNTYATAVTIFIYDNGANVTQVTINGVAQTLPLKLGRVTLPAGQQIVITYVGGYPTWAWVDLPMQLETESGLVLTTEDGQDISILTE